MSTIPGPDARGSLLPETAVSGGLAAALQAAEAGRSIRPVRVLIVDDHALNIRLLTSHLDRLGYQVATAGSGHDALRAISTDSPDVVLMDVLMPDLSGLDVLRTLRDDRNTADLPVILVSGLGDTEHIVEGLKLGANDYVTKPINLPILRARLDAQTALKHTRDALKRTAELLADELERQARELRAAGMLQRSILPQTPPATQGLTTAWCYEPATEVGGDLFDIIPLPGGQTFLFLADAMGHGVQAALVASTVKATLVAEMVEAEDLSTLMQRLDEAIGELFEDRFVTAAACVVDPARRRLKYALAGHPPILLQGPNGVVTLREGGLPLGTRVGLGYSQGEVEVPQSARLLLYSDGLTEAQNADGQQFGVDGLCDCFNQLDEADPCLLVSRIRQRLEEFRGPTPLSDDLTVLAASLD